MRIFAAIVLGLGCAHAKQPAVPTPEVASLRRQLAESQGRETDLQRKMEDLGNRIQLVQDQLESREVMASQRVAPRVPVDARADAPAPSENEEIEFAGPARDATAPRPLLRLVGSQMPQRQAQSAPPEDDRSASLPRAGRAAPTRELRTPDGEDRLPVMTAVPPVPGKALASASRFVPPSNGATFSSERPKTSNKAAAPDASKSTEPMNLYNTSIELLKQGQHQEAIAGLKKFVKSYPGHDYADNAQYWLGECYYDQKDFQSALREFRRVIQRFPTGNKTPDALLKVGFCYGQLADAKNERDVLEQVLKSYPGTDVARKAAEKLQAMK